MLMEVSQAWEADREVTPEVTVTGTHPSTRYAGGGGSVE